MSSGTTIGFDDFLESLVYNAPRPGILIPQGSRSPSPLKGYVYRVDFQRLFSNIQGSNYCEVLRNLELHELKKSRKRRRKKREASKSEQIYLINSEFKKYLSGLSFETNISKYGIIYVTTPIISYPILLGLLVVKRLQEALRDKGKKAKTTIILTDYKPVQGIPIESEDSETFAKFVTQLLGEADVEVVSLRSELIDKDRELEVLRLEELLDDFISVSERAYFDCMIIYPTTDSSKVMMKVGGEFGGASRRVLKALAYYLLSFSKEVDSNSDNMHLIMVGSLTHSLYYMKFARAILLARLHGFLGDNSPLDACEDSPYCKTHKKRLEQYFDYRLPNGTHFKGLLENIAKRVSVISIVDLKGLQYLHNSLMELAAKIHEEIKGLDEQKAEELLSRYDRMEPLINKSYEAHRACLMTPREAFKMDMDGSLKLNEENINKCLENSWKIVLGSRETLRGFEASLKLLEKLGKEKREEVGGRIVEGLEEPLLTKIAYKAVEKVLKGSQVKDLEIMVKPKGIRLDTKSSYETLNGLLKDIDIDKKVNIDKLSNLLLDVEVIGKRER